MKYSIFVLFFQWSVIAAPAAGVMNLGSISWSYEIQNNQNQDYCVVTVLRKDVVQSQSVWPKSLCEKRWDELERIVGRIKSPLARTTMRCAQHMALLSPTSSKKSSIKKRDICWDFAGRATEADFAAWWKKVGR